MVGGGKATTGSPRALIGTSGASTGAERVAFESTLAAGSMAGTGARRSGAGDDAGGTIRSAERAATRAGAELWDETSTRGVAVVTAGSGAAFRGAIGGVVKGSGVRCDRVAGGMRGGARNSTRDCGKDAGAAVGRTGPDVA